MISKLVLRLHVGSFLLLALHFLVSPAIAAGIGSGVFTAAAVVTLGGTTKPVRAFNMLLY